MRPTGAEVRKFGPKVAFVFSGGASYAAAQAGMLRAMTAAGIFPDLVVGASAGALNAVVFASEPTTQGVERLVRSWLATRRSDVFPIHPATLALGILGRQDHLVPSTRLERWLAGNLPVRSLEDTAIPVHVATTDRRSGELVILDHGPALPALMASTAVPGIFSAVTIDTRTLVDGGLSSDTPIGVAVAYGATKIFVLPSHAPAGVPRGEQRAAALLTYAYRQVLGHWTVDQAESDPTVDVEVLPVPSSAPSSPFDFSHTGQLIDSASRLTQQWLVQRSREVA
jgi:NTE family protein